jgi:hypothetical protein
LFSSIIPPDNNPSIKQISKKTDSTSNTTKIVDLKPLNEFNENDKKLISENSCPFFSEFDSNKPKNDIPPEMEKPKKNPKEIKIIQKHCVTSPLRNTQNGEVFDFFNNKQNKKENEDEDEEPKIKKKHIISDSNIEKPVKKSPISLLIDDIFLNDSDTQEDLEQKPLFKNSKRIHHLREDIIQSYKPYE